MRTNFAGELIICSLRSTPTADQVSKVQETSAFLSCIAAKQDAARRPQGVQTRAPLHSARCADSCASMEHNSLPTQTSKLLRSPLQYKVGAAYSSSTNFQSLVL